MLGAAGPFHAPGRFVRIHRPQVVHHDELEARRTQEAALAHDADQLDLIANLKEELDLGNRYAGAWIEAAVSRLRTATGRRLAGAITTTDHAAWWFLGPDRHWWSRKHGCAPEE